jgi:hypothetical protein
MLTIDPPPDRFMRSAQHFVPRKTPVTVMSMTRRHSSTGVSVIERRSMAPAAFTSTSSRP